MSLLDDERPLDIRADDDLDEDGGSHEHQWENGVCECGCEQCAHVKADGAGILQRCQNQTELGMKECLQHG